jgi:hypothetical protein
MSEKDEDAELERMQKRGLSQGAVRGGRKGTTTSAPMPHEEAEEKHEVKLDSGESPFVKLAKIADEALRGKYVGYSQRKK